MRQLRRIGGNRGRRQATTCWWHRIDDVECLLTTPIGLLLAILGPWLLPVQPPMNLVSSAALLAFWVLVLRPATKWLLRRYAPEGWWTPSPH